MKNRGPRLPTIIITTAAGLPEVDALSLEYKFVYPKIIPKDKLSQRIPVINDIIKEIIGTKEPKKGKILYRELENIQAGQQGFRTYENVIQACLEYIFSFDIESWEKQSPVNQRNMVIDLLGHPKSSAKCLNNVLTNYNIKSTKLVAECKNYNHKLKNPEYDQINGRLTVHRKFGIIICRNVANRKNMINSLFYRYSQVNDNKKVIIVFTDKDIKELLLLRDKIVDNSDDDNLNILYKYFGNKIEEIINNQPASQ